MDWWFLLRLFIATILGCIIGYERKLRFKEAGMRTHSIVALGSCLLMIISLNAFGPGSDKGRIAAQIVAGVGFLGTGMIMFKPNSGVHGLTTAAGIWVTAGVGMAIGGEMYILGVGATILIVIVQCILHLPIRLFKATRYVQFKITFVNSGEEGASSDKIKEIFEVNNFSKIKAIKENDKVLFTTVLSTDRIFDANFINKALVENDFIMSIERVDYE